MDLDTVSIGHTHIALRYLLARMSLETRGAMMGELPTVYAALFPGVPSAVIMDEVRMRLHS